MRHRFSKLLNSDEKKLLILAVSIRILLAALAVVFYRANLFCDYCVGLNFPYPPGELISWKTAFKTWDASLFLYLAHEGYIFGEIGNQMLPLFPASIWLLMHVLGDGGLLSGLLIVNLFSLTAFICLYRFLRSLYGRELAYRAAVYAITFPTAFYFSRIYSESLFLLLSILMFIFLYKGQYKMVFVSSFLLPMVRMVGILMVCPLLIFAWIQQRKAIQGDKAVRWPVWSCAAGPLMGFLFSMALMKALTGNWFEHFDAQKLNMAYHSLSGMLNIPKWFWANFIEVDWKWFSYRGSILGRLYFVGYLLLLWRMYRHQDKTLFCFTLVMGMVPALSDHFMSYSRLLIIIFPLYVELARLPIKHKWLQIAMLTCQAMLFIRHAMAFWVA